MIVFESLAKPLLFVHLVAAFVALASSIHCLVRLILLHRLKFPVMGPIRLHARTMALAYTVAMALGVIIYPTFRVRVRAEYLDAARPFVVHLFEMKEHVALLAFPLAGLVWWIARSQDFRSPDARGFLPALYSGLCFITGALGYSAWCGWYLASIRSL